MLKQSAGGAAFVNVCLILMLVLLLSKVAGVLIMFMNMLID
jgi:hypothetical protein